MLQRTFAGFQTIRLKINVSLTAFIKQKGSFNRFTNNK